MHSGPGVFRVARGGSGKAPPLAARPWVKTVHNVCGLACILGQTTFYIQVSQLPRNVAPKEWYPHSSWLEIFRPLRTRVTLPECVLLCFIDPRLRKISNEASSCPGIFSTGKFFILRVGRGVGGEPKIVPT